MYQLLKSTFLLFALLLLSGCQPADPQPPVSPGNGGTTGLELSPEMVREHNRGVALMGQFNYAEAHKVFAALVAKNDGWDDATVDLAIAKLNRRQEGDVASAEKLLDKVIARNLDDLRARYCRGILLKYAGDNANALAMFREVASADPSDAYATYYTGQCLFDDKQFEAALNKFKTAQALDPYLRSSYYGAFQSYQRIGKIEDAKTELGKFQKLAGNPQARNAEIKYSRMGPKAETLAMRVPGAEAAQPEGTLFLAAQPLLPEATWNKPPTSFTVCDINGDTSLDLYATGEVTRVLLSDGKGGFAEAAEHPLAGIADARAALWGDIDNDGHVDLYLCRSSANQLWKQGDDGKWQDVTTESKTSGGTADTVDGAMFDADHDGDLDLFLVNADGANELLNNNLDGTFRPLAESQGLTGGDRASRGIVVTDVDNDRDADILVIHEGTEHESFENDRLWDYQRFADYAPLKDAEIWALVAADFDADGQTELVTSGPDGVGVWTHLIDEKWSRRSVLKTCSEGTLAVQDFNGDGHLDIAVSTENGWAVVDQDGKSLYAAEVEGDGKFALLSTDEGFAVVAADPAKNTPLIWLPGPGRFPFALVEFTGKESKADQMRSNASGVGIRAAARVGNQWTSLQTFRDRSGPGQSHQPLPVGLKDAAAVDYVHLLWPDGLFQTELGLTTEKVHRIEETQRQVSSCPVLFVFNGEEYQFVTDILGVGGQGFNHGRGEYGPPRPWERLLLPAGLLPQGDSRFSMKVGEPMEESCYLDSIRLAYYDLPAGWSMAIDDRQATGDPPATGDPVFYRQSLLPISAKNDRNEDVLELITKSDRRPVLPGQADRRFLGHTAVHSLTLEFDQPLETLKRRPVMVMDGWVEYPYSQTTFASWQAGAPYQAPTLEARGSDGTWKIIYREFGYPAGMPRRMALPLDPSLLPQGTTALRLTCSMEIYWDHIFVVADMACPEATKGRCELLSAIEREVGFPRRTNTPDRQPGYDYDDRVPLWDTRHQPGYYSNFGSVLELVAETDDAVAIFGPGEEVEVEFEAPVEQPADGVTRQFVLESEGWCKDMDLYTKNGESIEPLPKRSETADEPNPRREKLHRKYNQRYRAG